MIIIQSNHSDVSVVFQFEREIIFGHVPPLVSRFGIHTKPCSIPSLVVVLAGHASNGSHLGFDVVQHLVGTDFHFRICMECWLVGWVEGRTEGL